MDILMLPDFDKIAEDTIFGPCVQKGVAYLDEHHQGWWQKIVPDELDMSCGSICICGFVFGDYVQRPEDLFDGAEFGFNLPTHIRDLCPDDLPDQAANILEEYLIWNCGRKGWRTLEHLWLDEIYWRASL